MTVAITVAVRFDSATPALRRFIGGMRPEQLQPVVGRSARTVYKDHLIGLNSSRANALGGPRTGFYLKAAQGTSFTSEGDHVIIAIASVGIAQRYFGGTIRAGASGSGAQYLTIPARAESHGKRASEFNDLELLWGRNGPYALARRHATLIRIARPNATGTRKVVRRGEQGGEILFWLKEEITQKEDPSVLPDSDKVATAVLRDIGAYAQLLIDRAGPN